MTLSDRLREAMDDAGMNQRDLAARVGLSPPSINGWLSGKSKFLRGENLLRAAAVLNVSDQWLATGKAPKKRTSTNSQTVRLDPEIVRDVARALHEVYRDELGKTYSIIDEPELFAEMYERVAELGDVESRSNLIWLGSRINRSAQQGASTDERSKDVHSKGTRARAPGSARKKA